MRREGGTEALVSAVGFEPCVERLWRVITLAGVGEGGGTWSGGDAVDGDAEAVEGHGHA
jgi:hypothetical protein